MREDESVTLREHLVSLMEERDRRYTERAEAADKAVNAALAAAEKAVNAALAAAKEAQQANAIALKEYKDGANEWRATVTDITARMPTNVEMDRRFDVVDEKIARLRAAEDKSTGKSVGLNAGWSYLIAAVALLVSVGTLLRSWKI